MAEACWLDLGIDVIKRTTGKAPRGWRAPLYYFSNRSLDLLLERGFAYDASLARLRDPIRVEEPPDWARS